MVAAFEKASSKVISYYFSSSSPRSHESSTQPDFLIFQKIPLKCVPEDPGCYCCKIRYRGNVQGFMELDKQKSMGIPGEALN
ncbi:hypothetical protein GYH30_027143 [Glycine max]|nr:hypothetical protein GYH30_027143 [Glycine max]